MEINNKEIRSFTNKRTSYASVGLLLILALAGLSGSLGGGLSSILSITFSIVLLVVAFWIFIHPKSYISINPSDKLFRSRTFGLQSHEIPIISITRIGISRTLLGTLPIITITYRKSDGKEKTVNSGLKSAFDRSSLQKVFRAMVEINPKLHIPTELE